MITIHLYKASLNLSNSHIKIIIGRVFQDLITHTHIYIHTSVVCTYIGLYC